MRSFLCLNCGEVYNESVENKDGIVGNALGVYAYMCPKMNCNGHVIEIDDFLLSVIRNLNKMGFSTLSCCSGHSYDSLVQNSNHVRTYILFERACRGLPLDDEMLGEIEAGLPEGFELSTDNVDAMDRFIISRSLSLNSESECIRAIGMNCADLLEWTENVLPLFIEKYEDEFEEYFYDFIESLREQGEIIGELDGEDMDSPSRVVY